MPLNTSRWDTRVESWGDAWSWDPKNVRTVAQLPAADGAGARRSLDTVGELPNASGYAALTMSYDPHLRGNTTIHYKSAAI